MSKEMPVESKAGSLFSLAEQLKHLTFLFWAQARHRKAPDQIQQKSLKKKLFFVATEFYKEAFLKAEFNRNQRNSIIR